MIHTRIVFGSFKVVMKHGTGWVDASRTVR